jgi:hypothetical protein
MKFNRSLPLVAILLSSMMANVATLHAEKNAVAPIRQDFCVAFETKSAGINRKIDNGKKALQALHSGDKKTLRAITSVRKETATSFSSLEKLAGNDIAKITAVKNFEAAVLNAQSVYRQNIVTAKAALQSAQTKDITSYKDLADTAISQRTAALSVRLDAAKQACASGKLPSQVRNDFLAGTKNDTDSFRQTTASASADLKSRRLKNLEANKKAIETANATFKAQVAVAKNALYGAFNLSNPITK